jgi:hypothetical protein
MDDADVRALEAFSNGQMTALDLRRRLNDATYGDILRLLSERNLPLPRASTVGREADIERARAWLFPKQAA